MKNLDKRIIAISPMVSMEVMGIEHTKRKASMASEYANKLKHAATNHRILGFGETPHFVSYLHNKRSFVLSTTNGKYYHIRAKFHNHFSWIYEMHRRMGQPQCCSRAHATGSGLPDESITRAHDHAYGLFSGASMVPCQKCFLQHKDDPYVYMEQVVAHNRLQLTADELTNRQTVISRIMIDLLNGSTPMCEELVGNERYIVSCAELRQMVRSIENLLYETRQLANQLIADTDENAADEWVSNAPLSGLVPRDLVVNNLCRNLTKSMDALEESISKLDVTKSNYDEIYNTQEFVVTIRRSLQSFEFSYNLTH